MSYCFTLFIIMNNQNSKMLRLWRTCSGVVLISTLKVYMVDADRVQLEAKRKKK